MTWLEKAMQNPELVKRLLVAQLCPNLLFPEAGSCWGEGRNCEAHWNSPAPDEDDPGTSDAD